MLQRKGEKAKSNPYAIKSLEIDNNYKPGYNELGYAYRTTGKYREAIEQFKKNIAISPVDIAMLLHGLLLYRVKKKGWAMEQYEALKKVNEKWRTGLRRRSTPCNKRHQFYPATGSPKRWPYCETYLLIEEFGFCYKGLQFAFENGMRKAGHRPGTPPAFALLPAWQPLPAKPRRHACNRESRPASGVY